MATFIGGSGDDYFLSGTAANDSFDGGAGSDAVGYTDAAGAVVVNLAAGTASGAAGNDVLISIEKLFGSSYGDTLTGNADDNYFVGAAGDDSLSGGGGSDTLSGDAGNDTLNGDAGVDTAQYSDTASNYTIAKQANSYTVTAKSGTDGTDTLTNIERLHFSNTWLALNMDAAQSGGATALLIGAVLGRDLMLSASKQALLGAAIGLFDQGYTLQQLSGAIMRLPIWDVLTNHAVPTNTDIANYLLTTVNRQAPDSATLNAAVNALNTETGAAQGNFLWQLAASDANQTQVGLAGLATTGLEFGV